MIFESKVKGPALSKRLQANSASKGFTLIELLVVIAIIGVLAAVVIVNLNVARAKSRDARRKSDLDSMRTALEMYSDRNGRYPVNSNWQTSAPGIWINDTSIPSIPLVPEFISVLPLDPKNVNPYYYAYRSPDGNNYKILAQTMESPEGISWANNDGGKAVLVVGGPCESNDRYELFSAGGICH